MSEFKKYRRTQIAEMRPYRLGEDLSAYTPAVSIAEVDRVAGSPKEGDMIARNPANHDDQWLVAADYFAVNFEPVSGTQKDEPLLGLATTRELLAEISARIEMNGWQGRGLDYKTVDSD